MSFLKNSYQQISINDSTNILTTRENKRLKNSWAEIFQKEIFPNINEDRFRVLYSENQATRPNTPTNVLIGALALKEMIGLTDEEIIESLMFDIRFQYALKTTSFEEQPLSDNSLTNFRKLNYEYLEKTGKDLIQEEVEELSRHMKDVLKISGKNMRMDSMMVSSNCKKLSRIDLVYTCIKNLVKKLEKDYPEELEEYYKKYLDQKTEKDTIYRCKSEEAGKKLNNLFNDAMKLYNMIEKSEIKETKEYKILKRWIEENTTETKELKTGKHLSPNSLQNPSDPDATYRKKYGDNIGYVANITENFEENKAIITSYDIKENTYSDTKFIKDEIEKMPNQKEEVNLMVDSAFYSDEISSEAKEKSINIITTGLVGYEPENKNILEFDIDEKEGIKRCPNNQIPIVTHAKNGMLYASFNKRTCEECPYKDNCKVKFLKKSTTIKIKLSQIHNAKLRKEMQNKEYKKLANTRAGIEGIPSVLRRVYQVDRMPVMGKVRSKIWFGFKILAINIKRLVKASQIDQLLHYICIKLEKFIFIWFFMQKVPV